MDKEDTLQGKLIHVKKRIVPSLGQILRRSQPWCDLFEGVKHVEVARETMIENTKNELNSAIVEAVHKLSKAGLTITEIAVDTGLSEDCVIQTLEALANEAVRQEEGGGQG